jgi:hypothetical protein
MHATYVRYDTLIVTESQRDVPTVAPSSSAHPMLHEALHPFWTVAYLNTEQLAELFA